MAVSLITSEMADRATFLGSSEFSEGRAFVSHDGDTFGFIDLQGGAVIKPEFLQCRLFTEGLAGVCRDAVGGTSIIVG
jgi:hypothetical protein